MTRTKVKRLTALGGAAALCFGVAAQAGTEQEVFSESFTVANIGSFKNIDVPQFDPQGGCRELLKVTLEAEGVGTGDYAFTNDSDTLCTGSVTINYGATVTFPFPSGPPPILECSQFDSVGPIPILLNPDETLDLPDLIDFQFSCMDMTDPGEDLSPFIGMGTIVARYDGDQDTDTEIDCDFTESLDTDFTGTITITYEYQPNPPQCDIKGLTSLCPATQDELYTVNIDAGDQPVDIVWSIVGDAEFCVDPAGGETALVCTDPVCGGSFTLTVTVTNPLNPDECFGECSLTVLLEDDEPPIITCPPDVTITCKDDSSPTGTGQATADDNCAPPNPVTIDFSDVESGNCPVIITRTWTATDFCDNTASCDQIITVTDLIPPVLNLPPDATITCKDDSSPGGTGQATATDNCDPNTIPTTFVDGPVTGNCPQTFTRTWTATDKCGNTASGDQVITINDPFPPTLAVPPDATITCKDDSSPGGTGQATATDNCDPNTIPTTFVDGPVTGNCPQTFTRTWTATDKCGNTASGDQVITINDPFPPTLAVPPDATITCKDDSSPGGTGQATATDNCDPNTIPTTFVDGPVTGNCPQTFTRTWTATDKCGNTASGDQVITINDPFPPTLAVPPDATITCKDDSSPGGTGQATATDNCDPNTIPTTFVDGPVTGNCPQTFTRTWTATDKCGNTASGDQVITINDPFPPTLAVPPDATITCKDDSSPGGTGQATATDNCDPNTIPTTFVDGPVTGNCPQTFTRTWTATDKCGNTASGDQVITINDPFPPTLAVPPDATITCKDDSSPGGTGQATATDNCDPNTIPTTFVDGPVTGNCPQTFTRTWTATDKCGNTASGDQVITINDPFPPTLAVPPDATITCKDDSSPGGTGQATATDNCDPNTIPTTFVDGPVTGNCPQTFTRTWTATDKCGNTASGDQVITINDPFPPTLAVPPDATITCKDDSSPGGTGQATATDNCDPNTIPTTFVDGPVTGNCPQTFTRTWTATDKCGNTASGDQVITINDPFPPTLAVPPDATITCKDDSSPGGTGQATATDNCDPNTIPTTFVDGPVTGNCPQTFTRTWTATDKCGNTASGDQVITINDPFPPTLAVPPDATITCKDDSSPGGTGQATATDNCDPNTIPTTFVDGPVTGNCPQTFTRTWTATDKCGNTASGDQVITINDPFPPTLAVPPDIKIDCEDDSSPGGTGEATATDNCDPGDAVVTFTEEVTGNCPVIITRTWVATDKCGNSSEPLDQVITLNDNFPPELSLPPDIKITCKDDSSPANTGSATADDNCDEAPAISFSDEESGNCPKIVTRTWCAVDKCGNQICADQIITINDPFPPTIECPQPEPGADCIEVECNTTHTFVVTAQDNCNPVTISFSVDFTEGSGDWMDLGGGIIQITLDGPASRAVVTATASDGCDDSLDATCEFIVCCGCEGMIGDKVWLDENGDGCQDPEEPGVEGVTVTLYRNCGVPEFETETTTDADGIYTFENLCEGEYLVVIEAPEGLTETTPNVECVPGDPGGSDELDSDCEGGEICVTLFSNDDVDLTNDCGLVCTGVIGDWVWNDLNQDGCQDPDEPGLEGVTVTLYEDCDLLIPFDTTTTDADGFYEFTDLCAGEYLVTFEAPDNYVETLPNQECVPDDPDASDELDSDCDGGEICVTLPTSDTVDNSNDCGFHVVGGEGCTPGYWKQEQHFCNWPAPYEPDQMFSMWFDDAFEGKSLLTVLSQPASSEPGPNQLNSLGRHTVAALLNAASLDVAYDLVPAAVIEMFNDAYPGAKADYNALKAIFKDYNQRDCPLGNCGANAGGGADDGGDWNPGGSLDPAAATGSANADSGSASTDSGHGADGDLADPGGPSPFINDDGLTPGEFGGILELDGDFVQTADGVLYIEVTGLNPIDGYDVLSVQGDASLNGVLLLDFVDGFEPQVGDRFEVFHARSITGKFVVLTRRNLGNDRSIEATYEPQTVAVQVVPGSDSCPADVTADRVVDNIDLLRVIQSWGANCGAACAEDVDGDGAVGAADLLHVVGAWGLCQP